MVGKGEMIGDKLVAPRACVDVSGDDVHDCLLLDVHLKVDITNESGEKHTRSP